MTATAHALVGAAIAAASKNPYLGVLFASASHPILDMIPHWDSASGWREKSKLKFFIEATLDLSLGLVLAYLFYGSKVEFFYLMLCILAAIGWDLMEIPYWFWKWHFPPFSWSHNLQSKLQGQAKLPWGIVTQIIVVGSIMWILSLVD